MKLIALVTIIMVFALTACSKPTVDSPDPGSYGQTIKPDHKVPEEHRN
ncbi:MAG TPA: hypothetical protein PK439_08595 [Nitrosomonas sp.]|nr:hypothetical protein [Nitrosomonas sp.]HRB46034.1 hypothetical protein [Nitrosomonas sp.]